MGKKALCLIFAFLLSINSFAAVVSDNDGAAFITKAEFEALKTDFNDQIENYNASIDNKIDGAIASYLAGLGRKEIDIEQDLGIYQVPLDMYMNFNDVLSSGFSQWKPAQYWKVMIGYYSAYISGQFEKVDSSNWQPRQWYALEKENGNWVCSGGYKKITDRLEYVVWGLSDTGLGTASPYDPNTAVPNHCYLFGANANLSSYWAPSKADANPPAYDCLATGDYKWDTSNTSAPTTNGVTSVRDDAGATPNIYFTYNSSTRRMMFNGAVWYSGWFDTLFSTQSSTQEQNYVNALTNKPTDLVHVLYDGKVIYSVRDDELYAVGPVNSASTAYRKGLTELRTFQRNKALGRYVYGCAMPYFTIVKEGWNTKTTTIDFSNFENTSLIKASHVSQKYTGKGSGGADLNLGISDGLYLCTPDQEGDITLKINIDSSALGSSKPYIIVNTRGINETALPTDMKAAGFKKLEGGTEVTTATKDYARALSNGKNTIKVLDCAKNKPLVVKILWDETSTARVRLKEAVEITLNPEGL